MTSLFKTSEALWILLLPCLQLASLMFTGPFLGVLIGAPGICVLPLSGEIGIPFGKACGGVVNVFL